MRAIRKRFLYCLGGAMLCAVAAVWFACRSSWVAAVLFAAAAAPLALCAIRASVRYQTAKLICDNPILNVGVANVLETAGGAAAESSMNVIVSGFGILMDGRPYKFGNDSVKLTRAQIDRESISLSFGSEEKAYAVRLLHGIASKADIDKLKEQLRYETGVIAEVRGWQA